MIYEINFNRAHEVEKLQFMYLKKRCDNIIAQDVKIFLWLCRMVESRRLKYQNGLSGRFCFERLIDPAISEMKIVLLSVPRFSDFPFQDQFCVKCLLKMQACCQVFWKFACILYVVLMEQWDLHSGPNIEVDVEYSCLSTSVGFHCYTSHILKLMAKYMNLCTVLLELCYVKRNS
jgi:hypothetical protein